MEPITRDIEEHIENIRMLIPQKQSAIRNPKLSPEDKKLAEAFEISSEELKRMKKEGYTMMRIRMEGLERRTSPKLKAIGFIEWPNVITMESTKAHEEAKITNKTVNDAALEEYDLLAKTMNEISNELKERQELLDDPTLVVAALEEMIEWSKNQLEALQYTLRNMDL